MKKQNFRIKFDKNAIEKLKKYQQKNKEPESGGILVGEIYPKLNKVIIKDIVVSKKLKEVLEELISIKKRCKKN